MNKIKILQIGFSYKVGGIETFAINSMETLDKNEYEVYFINVFNEAKQEKFYKKMGKIGKIFDLSDYRKHPFKFFKEFKKLNKKIHFDIVHYNMASASYLMPIIAAKKCGIKTIIAHAHNNASDKGIIKEIIHRFNKKFIPFFANYFFACSDSAVNWFYSKQIIKTNKYRILPNSIDVYKFSFDKSTRNSIRSQLNIPNDATVYGHVGSFKTIKNHAFLIDVFNEIYKKDTNSYLALIGKGPLMEKMKEKVKNKKLENHVIFLGQKEDVHKYFNIMDSFILPSINEGLGIVLIEAQANGLPCFVSNNIPKEAEINENFYRLNLCDNPIVWANYILEKNKLRVDNNRVYVYDNKSNADKLSKMYKEMKKIKICHFVYGIKNGGVEKVIFNYFSNIDKNKYELHIISQGDDDEKNKSELEKIGFKIHNVTKKNISVIKNFLDIKRILTEEKFDIVHCHMSITNIFPLLYSKICGVKIRINHSHNAMIKKNIFQKIMCKLSMFVDTDRMACSKDAALWAFNSDSNVKILYNAINIEDYKYDYEKRLEIRKKLKIKDNEIVLGCVGRLENQKNQQFILKVLKRILESNNNYKMVLVGIGDNEDLLKKITINEGISDKVLFLGSRNDVKELYQAFDIFVLPSLYEGLGIVYVEAQISGLKCFASTNVPADTKITNNINYLELKEEIWVDEILKIGKYDRKSYLKEARNLNYDIKTEAKKLDNYYIELLNKE